MTRHTSVDNISRFFEYGHLPEPLSGIASECASLKDFMLGQLDDDPELVVGLRKLLEAKDCFVRAAVAQHNRYKGNNEHQGKPL